MRIASDHMYQESHVRESYIREYNLIINMVYYINLKVKCAENTGVQLFLVLFLTPQATAHYHSKKLQKYYKMKS